MASVGFYQVRNNYSIDRFVIASQKKAIQIRIINTGDTDVFGKLKTKFKLTALTNGQIDEIIEILKKSNASSANNDELKKCLRLSNYLLITLLLFNSRYFRLDGNFGYEELDQIIEFEVSQRLNLIPDIMEAYPDEFRSKKVSDFNLVLSGLDNMDWFDLVTSIVTKSFHVDEKGLLLMLTGLILAHWIFQTRLM